MCEPLRGKRYQQSDEIEIKYVKSAVEGLIRYHEAKIEELIKKIDQTAMQYDYMKWIDTYVHYIKREYEDIMVIEHWLEDVL